MAHSVANQSGTADEVERFERIAGHASITHVFRAGIVVFRYVVVEVFDDRPARSIANDLFAIAGYLRRDRRTHCRKRLPAHVVHARAHLAIVIERQQHAIGRNVALDARAYTVANVGLTNHARRTLGNAGVRRDSRHTHVQRARIHVVGKVGVVADGRIHSVHTDLQFAIAHRLIRARRRKPIEQHERAGSSAHIARIFCTGILIVTRQGGAAFDGANATRAMAGRNANGAHRPIRQRRMNRTSIRAAIGRARLGVVLDISVVVRRDDGPIHAIVTPTITGRLLRERTIRQRQVVTFQCRHFARIDRARIAVLAIPIIFAQ
jgi:hypothetical protein